MQSKGLVAYYPFNGNANDESGNGNDGTVNGLLATENLKSGSRTYSSYIKSWQNRVSLSLWALVQTNGIQNIEYLYELIHSWISRNHPGWQTLPLQLYFITMSCCSRELQETIKLKIGTNCHIGRISAFLY